MIEYYNHKAMELRSSCSTMLSSDEGDAIITLFKSGNNILVVFNETEVKYKDMWLLRLPENLEKSAKTVVNMV